MIGYDEALKIARKAKKNIDQCIEHENAYVFGFSGDDEMIGGGASPVVIMKDDGRAVTMPYYVMFHATKEIRTIKI